MVAFTINTHSSGYGVRWQRRASTPLLQDQRLILMRHTNFQLMHERPNVGLSTNTASHEQVEKAASLPQQSKYSTSLKLTAFDTPEHVV